MARYQTRGHGLSERNQRELQNAFDMVDKNKDGLLQREELRDMLRGLDNNISDKEVN